MARALFSRKRSTYQQSIWHSYAGPVCSPEHKVVLLGVAGVGKTSYFLRVRDGSFVCPESTCFPADFLEKKVEVSASDDFSLKVDHCSLHPAVTYCSVYTLDNSVRHCWRREVQNVDVELFPEGSCSGANVQSG